MIADKVDNLLEIVGLGLEELLIAGEQSNVALRVADGHSAPILRPAQTVERIPRLTDLLAHNRNFHVAIDIPDVDESFSIA